MALIGGKLTGVSPGEVTIQLPFREELTQQHNFLHGGIVTTAVDSACGYAALSLMPADSAVLTIEYKVNFMSPAAGERIIASGRVTRPGRTITVCTGNVFAVNKGHEKLIATMLATMMRMTNPNLRD